MTAAFATSMVIAALVGCLLTWSFYRGRVAIAESVGRSAGEVERATLIAQVASLTGELSSLRGRIADVETRASDLQSRLEHANQERAQMETRAERVFGLESALEKDRSELEGLYGQIAQHREEAGRVSANLADRQSQIARLEQEQSDLRGEREALQRAQLENTATLAALRNSLEAERIQTAEKLGLLEQAKQQLSDQFKTLASEILEDKSRRFTEQNQVNLSQLLDPLKEKVQDFRAKVEEIHRSDIE